MDPWASRGEEISGEKSLWQHVMRARALCWRYELKI